MRNFDSDIMVSINCITYNHEKYIKDAIEGFLMQKTKFKYEILIHDDASTDRTPDIIKKYEQEYPDIIKPIYEIENQYSQGKRVNFEFNYKRSKGKYIALCEGDDYWTDPYKLQKQVDFLEQHTNFSMCFHSVEVIDENGTELQEHWLANTKVGKITTLKDILKGDYIPTASTIFRNKLINSRDFYILSEGLFFEDWIYHIMNAKNGPIYYFKEKMGVYRVTNAGLIRSTDKIRMLGDVLTLYERLENYFDDSRIISLLSKRILETRLDILREQILRGNFKEANEILENIKAKDVFMKVGLKRSLKYFLLRLFPDNYREEVVRAYKKLRGIKE